MKSIAMRRILHLICVFSLLLPQVPLLVPHHHHVVRDGEAERMETHFVPHRSAEKAGATTEAGAQVASRSGCEEAPHPEAVKEEPKAKAKVFATAILEKPGLDVAWWEKPVRQVAVPTSHHPTRPALLRNCLGRAPPSA